MYLLRLDDASEHWNKNNWHRIHDLLEKYDIKPIVAIIPLNRDKELMRFPVDPLYEKTIKTWILSGWIPAMHGCNHVVNKKSSGMHPVHNISEFAGCSISAQRELIREGYRKMLEIGIKPLIFVAPFHTFDRNTLTVLKEETDISIINDTVARDIYYKDCFYFIPQQSGTVRSLKLPIVTFCYHPNVMNDESFSKLERFIRKHRSEFISFDNLELKKRQPDFIDRILSFAYFAMRKHRGSS